MPRTQQLSNIVRKHKINGNIKINKNLSDILKCIMLKYS